MIAIEPAADLAEARELIEEYARATGVDLEFQHFSEEMASLSTFYEAIFIARVDGALAGCVSLRRIDDAVCEMKRLYLRPHFRGHDLGRRLAERAIAEARGRGYERMRLDTLPTMTAAIRMYESMGFTDIEPYRYNPVAGTRYLELRL